jgi:Uma2 family endonuclease
VDASVDGARADYCPSRVCGSPPLRCGAVFNGPGELELDHFTLVRPDVFVVPLVDGRRPRSQDECGDPLLFVEVLSPSTARLDRVVKRARYQRANVESWIVDLDARLIERWLPDASGPEICTEEIAWHIVGVDNPLRLSLPPLFVDALGEL